MLRSRKSHSQLSGSQTDKKDPSFEGRMELHKLKEGGADGVRVQHSEDHVEYLHMNGVDYV